MTLEPDYKYERERLRTFQSWPANAKVTKYIKPSVLQI